MSSGGSSRVRFDALDAGIGRVSVGEYSIVQPSCSISFSRPFRTCGPSLSCRLRVRGGRWLQPVPQPFNRQCEAERALHQRADVVRRYGLAIRQFERRRRWRRRHHCERLSERARSCSVTVSPAPASRNCRRRCAIARSDRCTDGETAVIGAVRLRDDRGRRIRRVGPARLVGAAREQNDGRGRRHCNCRARRNQAARAFRRKGERTLNAIKDCAVHLEASERFDERIVVRLELSRLPPRRTRLILSPRFH